MLMYAYPKREFRPYQMKVHPRRSHQPWRQAHGQDWPQPPVGARAGHQFPNVETGCEIRSLLRLREGLHATGMKVSMAELTTLANDRGLRAGHGHEWTARSNRTLYRRRGAAHQEEEDGAP